MDERCRIWAAATERQGIKDALKEGSTQPKSAPPMAHGVSVPATPAGPTKQLAVPPAFSPAPPHAKVCYSPACKQHLGAPFSCYSPICLVRKDNSVRAIA